MNFLRRVREHLPVLLRTNDDNRVPVVLNPNLRAKGTQLSSLLGPMCCRWGIDYRTKVRPFHFRGIASDSGPFSKRKSA